MLRHCHAVLLIFSALGSIQLSFEYNSKTHTFKVRVWAVTDLLLPPGKPILILIE